MQAAVGDRLHVHGNTVGESDRTGRIVVMKGAMRGEEAVVNSESFRRKDVSKIPVDQVRCLDCEEVAVQCVAKR